eukprot:4352932-Amphidinium_carterae.1
MKKKVLQYKAQCKAQCQLQAKLSDNVGLQHVTGDKDKAQNKADVSWNKQTREQTQLTRNNIRKRKLTVKKFTLPSLKQFAPGGNAFQFRAHCPLPACKQQQIFEKGFSSLAVKFSELNSPSTVESTASSTRPNNKSATYIGSAVLKLSSQQLDIIPESGRSCQQGEKCESNPSAEIKMSRPTKSLLKIS